MRGLEVEAHIWAFAIEIYEIDALRDGYFIVLCGWHKFELLQWCRTALVETLYPIHLAAPHP